MIAKRRNGWAGADLDSLKISQRTPCCLLPRAQSGDAGARFEGKTNEVFVFEYIFVIAKSA